MLIEQLSEKVLENEITLNWERFNDYEAIYKKRDKSSGVYVLADDRSLPLYIGSTRNKKGFGNRYEMGLIDAAMDGTNKHIFFAKVDSGSCLAVEKQLIWEEQTKFNHNGKKYKPKEDMLINHFGDKPNFKH